MAVSADDTALVKSRQQKERFALQRRERLLDSRRHSLRPERPSDQTKRATKEWELQGTARQSQRSRPVDKTAQSARKKVKKKQGSRVRHNAHQYLKPQKASRNSSSPATHLFSTTPHTSHTWGHTRHCTPLQGCPSTAMTRYTPHCTPLLRPTGAGTSVGFAH